MDLLQHLVLMDAVTLLSAILMLLVALLSGFGDSILGVLVGAGAGLVGSGILATPLSPISNMKVGKGGGSGSCK